MERFSPAPLSGAEEKQGIQPCLFPGKDQKAPAKSLTKNFFGQKRHRRFFVLPKPRNCSISEKQTKQDCTSGLCRRAHSFQRNLEQKTKRDHVPFQ
ncbi:MAG: hypothetical protein IK129_00445 [Deltaproteobacteria bacterium]|nr:hypothetical protein [Deltaproteobacteria bacterium]